MLSDTHKKKETEKERRSGELKQAKQSNKANDFTYTHRTFLHFVRFNICSQNNYETSVWENFFLILKQNFLGNIFPALQS